MMKFMIAGIIILTVASIVLEFVSRKKEKQVYENLTKLIIAKDFKKFDEIIDLPETKRYFPQFNHLFLKLNKEILVGNSKKAEALMESLDGIKLNTKQKEAFYSKAFYYSVAKEDEAMARKYHDAFMNNCKNGCEEIDRVFDTMIDHGHKYLQVTLDQLQNANPTMKIQLYSLLSTMYENKGDTEKSEEYTAKLKKAIEDISNKK